MKVIAIRQIHGTYGNRVAGESFDVDHCLGQELLKRKLVRTPEDVEYEVKAIQPSSSAITPEHTEPRNANKKR